MPKEEKTYQPGWGEKKKHHHHLHYEPNYKNRRPGGSLRMRDKQAYIGLMLVLVVILLIGAFKLTQLFLNELREMPNDNPSTEMNVDVLGVRIADEANALEYSDSIARDLKLDSIRKTVQVTKHNVYRPPRKNTDWFINDREWKAIKKNYKIWLKTNGEDPKFILGVIGFTLFILVMVIYAIHRYRHRNE